MSGEGRVRPPLSFDDPVTPGPAIVPPSRRIDREAAQAVAEKHGFNRAVTKEPRPPAPVVPLAPAMPADWVDGRSLRRTGRTTQMNVKVREDVRARFVALAQARGEVSLGELIEEALVLLEQKHRGA